MKRILLVQRSLTHYRKLLLRSLEERGEYKFDILCIGKENTSNGNLHYFKATKLFQYKTVAIERSYDLINYIKKNYDKYDYIVLEGATNIINNIPICKYLLKKEKPYIVWDAGRRKNAKMSILRKLAQKPLEYVWKNASAIIAYSTLAREYFLKVGIEEKRIFICQNTLNVAEFDEQISKTSQGAIDGIRGKYTSENGKLILYVGAIEQRKRIKDLIEAFDIVHNRLPSTSLVIIGGGIQLEELREFTKDRENVFLLGQIIDGVIEYFMACDLFVLPSEGGLSLNQAMICGKPIIASSADGTELDLIEQGKNGFIFQEKNIEQLADCIIKILFEDKLRQQMGRYSRDIINKRVNEKRFYDNFKRCLESVG